MKKALATLMIAALTLVVAACPNGTQKLATASDAVSHALLNAQTAAQQAVQAGVMSQGDFDTFNRYLAAVATSGQQLDAAIRANESATSVSQKVTNFMDAFNALQKTGLVGIKDPKTQLAISTIITSAESSIAIIAATVGGK